ncbi:acetaldehyde dehydrogenase [Sphingomonas melonis]|uniref:Acetaldehyde dehydrogenase n=1 Tax=Sphingomonas melonis TaxID=152682 RepID=A0A0D1KYE4_9SPHN|nr:DUF779 domain-containing protein [Sphingomonas melonis]KIU29334.1 acetaldehyde dehydrogenase [Sphingomonas melonis]
MTAPPRVLSTAAADAVMADLTRRHGALMFHQSGGCCDGSAPMCYQAGEFRVGGQDILLGSVGPDAAIPVWIGAAQFDYWRHTQITIDVVPGRGAGFSLEGPDGLRFIVRSRVFTDAEVDALDAAGPPPRGDDA